MIRDGTFPQEVGQFQFLKGGVELVWNLQRIFETRLSPNFSRNSTNHKV